MAGRVVSLVIITHGDLLKTFNSPLLSLTNPNTNPYPSPNPNPAPTARRVLHRHTQTYMHLLHRARAISLMAAFVLVRLWQSFDLDPVVDRVERTDRLSCFVDRLDRLH